MPKSSFMGQCVLSRPVCAPVFTLSYEENSPMPKSSFLGQCLLSRPVDRIERGGELDYEILCNILVGASR